MNDRILFSAIAEPLDALLTAYGVQDLPILRGGQPTPQGRHRRGVYLTRIIEAPHGWQGHKSRQRETRMVERAQTTWQVQVFTPRVPGSNVMTALDLAYLVRGLLQSPQYVAALRRLDVGAQIPTAVQPLTFINENDRYEDNPTFQFTVSHKASIILQENEVSELIPGIHRV